MDDPEQSAARLRLAKGFFKTVGLQPQSSEHEIRNALSRCYYSFFHLSHVVLGRYRGHELVATEIGDLDDALGELVTTLQALRIEADYIPDVVHRKYGGERAEYRLRANLVLSQAETQFKRMIKIANTRLRRRRRR